MQGSIGRWTKEEHKRFLYALDVYGKNWKKVQECVGTRTTTQTRSHAQKYFAKMNTKPHDLKMNNSSENFIPDLIQDAKPDIKINKRNPPVLHNSFIKKAKIDSEPKKSVERRVDEEMHKMSIEKKNLLLHGNKGKLSIPNESEGENDSLEIDFEIEAEIVRPLILDNISHSSHEPD